MLREFFLAAIIAAVCAGLVTSVIQHVRLTPMIVAAESYEHDEIIGAETDAVAHVHEEDEWMPADGIERTTFTIVANLLVAAGFAFVIAAVSLGFNLPVTAANGVLWGVAGFVVFSLAPAIGLPPGLPGMPVADTFARQFWWAFAAVSTAAALLVYVKQKAVWAVPVAIVLIVLPHVIGAPQPPLEETGVPPGLAAAFASAVIGNGFAFWLVLGATFGLARERFATLAVPGTGAPATA